MSTKNALIIGASGGIGRALADALEHHPASWQVLRTSRQPGADVVLDLEHEVSIRDAAAVVSRRVERLHLLIVASGLLHGPGVAPEKRLEDLDPAALARSFAVNAVGPVLVARHFMPLLQHDERATFAALSARVGSIGDNHLGGWYGYRASKAALNQFLRTLSIEASRRARSLICVGLHPGTVDTALSEPFQGNVPPGKLFSRERAAEQLLAVLDGLTLEDSGRVFAWDGQPIEW